MVEQLEQRLLMNSDWRNPARPLDVNNDMYVSPLDALVVINALNSRGASSDLGVRQNRLASYLDTNGDRNLSPLDALVVINELNRSDRAYDNASQRIDGEAETAPAGFVSIVMGGLPGTRDQIVALSSQLTIGREEFNEMGLFVVDGPNGAVNGVLPSSPNYSTEVFATANRQVLYSKRSVFRTAREATFPAGTTLGVYVLQETSDNGDGDKHLRVRETGTSKVRIGWEEHFSPSPWIGVGDRGYDDVMIDMTIGQPFDGNAEPVITAIPNQFMNEETELSIQTLAMDADLPNDSLGYSLDIAPTGATIDPLTGRFRWTPTEAQGPGNFEVIIRATDREGAFDTEAFTVTVLEFNRPPVLQPIADKQLEIGKNYSFNTIANDPDLPANTLTYNLLAGAPAGATIDSRTGVFNWLVPQNIASGGYPISVRVSDGGSPVLSDTKSFTVTVGSCIFGSQLEGWTVAQTGGSATGKGTVTASACSAVITEGDSFITTLRTSFMVPAGATEVSFRINNLNFDQNDPRFINDAFEVSVVDNQGRPLVAPYQSGRDAAWNRTENLAVSKSSSVTVDQDKIRLSLIGIPSGEQATLIFRLVNNDSDRTSSVVISDVTVPGFGTLSTSPVIGGRSGQSATRSLTIAADPPIDPQVLTSNPNEDVLPSRLGDSILSNLTSVSFTTPADFSNGSLFNTLIGTSPDILNLSPSGETTLLPFIWIANSGEGSVSLFNTQTGKELGRYRTGPNSVGGGLSPSRIGVAGDGSAWVANRAPGLQGSVIKVMNEGFIDRNGNGIVDTSTDRNSNGRIDPDELMAWDANNDGQPDDEKISFSIPVGRNPANPTELRSNGVARALAVDANDNVWVGIFNQRQYEVYDGKTGQFLAAVATPGTPYGALIDSQGILWGATLDDNRIEKIDTQTRTLVKSYQTGTSNYGISIDTDGVIWTSPYPGTEVTRLDPRTEEITRYNVGVQSGGGITVDRQENIWFVGYNTDRMYKLTIGPDRKTIVSQTSLSVPGQPKAASIDADGFLWTTTLNDSRAYKIDTTTSTVVPGWPIATGLFPYNYSDMTGAIRQGITARRGTWTEIVDAQRENAKWAVARVIATTPPNTSVTIRLRASNSRQALENLPWVEVQSGAAMDSVVGRYLQTELLLQSASRDVQPTVSQFIVDAVPPPNLSIFRPFEEISRVGKRVIEGHAEAAQVVVQPGVVYPNSIESVTVNGQPVDVFDASGNFYANIDIAQGLNEFQMVATDRYGQQSTRTVAIWGKQLSRDIDFSRFSESTDLLIELYGRTSFDDASSSLHVELATKNESTFVSNIPLLVAVKNLSDPSVAVLGFDGLTPDGLPYFDYSKFVADGTLSPGEQSDFPSISFHNPNRVQFDYDLVFYSQLNTPPEITSIPDIEALSGKQYVYPLTAIDEDNDTLKYRLTESPAGMTIVGATGKISWTPNVGQIGNHKVVVQVDDGRGGNAIQTYTISLIAAPPNRPPVITSVPVVSAIASTSVRGDGFPDVVLDYFASGSSGRIEPYGRNPNGQAPEPVSTNIVLGAPPPAPRVGWVPTTRWLSIPQGSYVTLGFSDEVIVDGLGNDIFIRSLDPADSAGESADIYVSTNLIDFVLLGRTPQGGNVGLDLAPLGLKEPVKAVRVVGLDNRGSSPGFDLVSVEVFPNSIGDPRDYLYDVDAVDPDDDVLNYSLTTTPSGMSINPVSGLIHWSPTHEQIGDHHVKVEVSDGRGGLAFQEFIICVRPDPNNHPPLIISSPSSQFDIAGTSNVTRGNVTPSAIILNTTEASTKQSISMVVPDSGTDLGSADIIFIVDESGSMAGEQAWLGNIIQSMDSSLSAAGLTNNRFGLVGFTSSGRVLRSGAEALMTAASFKTASGLLSTGQGGAEDGYLGIDFALRSFQFRPGTVRCIVLVTDEERTTVSSSLTFASTRQLLLSQNINFSLIANANLKDTSDSAVFGVAADGTAYSSDGSGGSTSTSGGRFVGSESVGGGDITNIKTEYVDLAWQADGITWDLNFLRDSAAAATVFTEVFVDVLSDSIVRDIPIDVRASIPGIGFQNLSGIKAGALPGQTVSFDVSFDSNRPLRFDLQFINANDQTLIASIPVILNNNYLYQVQAVDPDDDDISYSLVNQVHGISIDPNSGIVSWNSPIPGTTTVEVRASDGRGGSDIQLLELNIRQGTGVLKGFVRETPPSTVPLGGAVVYLDGNNNARLDTGETFTTTDPTGSYQIVGLSPGTYSVRSNGKLGYAQSFPLLPFQGYQTELVANETKSDLDFLLQPISTSDLPLQLLDIPLLEIQAGRKFYYQLESLNSRSGASIYSLLAPFEGVGVHATSGILSWQPSLDQIGEQNLAVGVTDGNGRFDSQTIRIRVQKPNSSPVFISTIPTQAVLGRSLGFDLILQDADGDFVNIQLSSGSVGSLTESSTTLPNGQPGPKQYRFEWTPNSADVATGKRTIRFEANDGHGGVAIQSLDVTVLATAPNRGPSILSKPRTITYPGVPYAHQVIAEDLDGNPLQYSLAKRPPGMTISAQGLIEWSTDTLLANPQDVEVVVADGQGGTATQKFQIRVTSQLENTRPTIVSNPKLAGRQDRLYSYDAVADDAQGDEVVWSLVRGPIGMSIGFNNGRVRWTPRDDQMGSNTVTIRATDTLGAYSDQSFAIDVACVNTPPLILSNPITQAYAGELYLYGVRGLDPDGESMQFKTIAAPTGMTISETGLIRWTPVAADEGQTRRVVVEVSDIDGAKVLQTYDIVVQGSTNRNRPPVITSFPGFSVTTGATYRYAITATDPDNDAVTFSLVTNPLGMTIDATTGVVTWTPTSAAVENVVVEARDARGAIATQGFAISVRDNRSPVISSTPSRTMVAGGTYRYAVNATDPDGDALTYIYLDGGPGSLMDSQGRITWNVPSDFAKNGPVQVPMSVLVRDARGAEVKQDYTLTVSADTEAPQVLLQIRAGNSVSTNDANVDIGSSVVVRVLATDNVGIDGLTLDVEGVSVPLNAAGEATVPTTVLGTIVLRGRATDRSGNLGEKLGSIKVVNSGSEQEPPTNDPTLPPNPGPVPGDTKAPLVSITSPEIGASVTSIVPIIGTIDDPENHLWYWRTYYARLDLIDVNSIDLSDPDLVQIAQGTNEVINAEIAKFDPTKLDNDAYVILVAAFDVNGSGYVAATIVNVEGNVKLGQFNLDFTDLSIPLAGIPIQLTRTYDTRQAGREGDFGYGWSLGVQDARILEVAAIGASGAFGNGEGTFVPDKTKVYLTNPTGQRVGFTYKEAYASGAAFLIGCSFGCFYTPSFVPDPGVYDTLTIDETSVSRGGILGALVGGINPDKYTLTTKDGTKYRYDEASGLEKITDRNNQTVTFTESGIKHSSGTEIQFVRDHRGRIKEVVDPDGNRILYEYDATGDLKKVTNQSGIKSTYNYLAKPTHYLDEGFDDLGQRDFKVIYDSEGRFKEIIDALGNSVGKQIYDELAGRRATVLDANGNATQLLYDERGNVLEETDATGNKTLREYTDPRNPDLETKIIDRRGMVTERAYDAQGNVTVIRELGPLSNPLASPVLTEFTYNSNNDVTSIKNASGAATSFNYDANGNVTKIVNPLGASTSFTYDDQGRRATVTDFNGNTTTFDYDGACPCGSPHKLTNADGTYQTFEYNQFGQVTKDQTFEANGTLVEQKQTFYDASGRVTREIIGAGTDPLHPPTEIRRFYQGNLIDWEIIVSPQSLNPDGSLKESPSTPVDQRKSRITDYEYDSADRLIRQTDAMGGIVNFRYDAQGNRVLLQDPAGNITTWTYDTLNRVSEERDPFYWVSFVEANSSLSSNALLDAVILENQKASGASLANNQGAAHVRSFGYDTEGNQSEVIDRNNRRREFSYDQNGRLLTEQWFEKNDGPLVETIAFTYDVLGNLKTAQNANSKYTYEYDQLSRVGSVDNSDANSDTARVILTYEYDLQGNVIRTSDNEGVTVFSSYNKLNQLVSRQWFDAIVPAGLTKDVEDTRIDFNYNAAGREKQILRYSSLTDGNYVGSTDLTYDQSSRTSAISHRSAVDSLISNFEYGYDFSGLLVDEKRNHSSNIFNDSIAYNYDLTGQLVDAFFINQDDEHYVYGKNGDRKSSINGSEIRTYVTSSANQLESDGFYNYEYDGEGNQSLKTRVSDGQVVENTWDHSNRLIKVEERSAEGIILKSVEYKYDVFGRRIAELVDGVLALQVVHDGDHSWGDYANGVATSRYLFGDRIDQLIASNDSQGRTNWYLADKQGTVRTIVLESGANEIHYGYSSFGAVIRTSGIPFDNRFLYNSRESTSTGIYFYRARFFDTANAGFLSRDPTGFSGGDSNLFRYVNNSPSNATDPTGKVAAIEYSALLEKGINRYAGALIGGLQGFGTTNLIFVGEVIGSSGRDFRSDYEETARKIDSINCTLQRLVGISELGQVAGVNGKDTGNFVAGFVLGGGVSLRGLFPDAPSRTNSGANYSLRCTGAYPASRGGGFIQGTEIALARLRSLFGI